VESGVSFANEIAPAVPRGLGKRAWIGIAAAALIVVVGLVALKSRGTAKPAADAAGAASAMSDAKSIAVLPFVNMSSDKEQEYFSDGISEELLNLLARVPGLRVAARTSSFSFKGKAVEIPEIARQLRVAHVLEGSVRKAGTQVRITAQLIHAADGYHLWSQTYDRKLDDVFAIQDEIAADVVGQLKVALLGEAPKARETNGEAYALYLQSRQLGRLATPDGFAKADALLHRAIQIDPRYAPAWSALTAIELNRMGSGMVPVAEGLPKAREAVTKAIEIDPQFAPGHAQLGWIAVYFEDDLPSAARHFERALALDPKDQNVRGNATIMLQALGRSDEAARLLGQLAELDPLNLTAQNNAGYVYLYAGRVDDAIASFRTALTLAPDMGAARTGLGLALLRKGDAQAAIEEIQKEPVEFWRLYGLPMVYHVLGRKADSDAALAQFIAKYEKEAASNVAAVYAFRGEADKAFEWLDKAVGYKDPGLAEVPLTGYFVDLYADPRWTSFLRKTNRAPDQLAKIQFKMPPMP
jgi:TolB-like protein/Flp pilus assembly protein TadD